MSVRFLRTIRLLAECYQAFETRSGRHVRRLGLTPAQFDIVATLGRTPGMNFKDLSEQTLITKGTLSGVIDRMVERGWLQREPIEADGRKVFIRLTAEGEALFERVFPEHISYLQTRFRQFSAHELDAIDAQLQRVRDALR